MTSQDGREYLSAAELGALLSYARTRADLARQKGTTRAVVDELIVLLLAGAGLRPSELRGLKVGDLPGTHGETALWIRNTNGGITRKVNITKDLAERLAKFVRFYRNRARDEGSVLESERATRLSYMSIYSKVRRIGREARIGELSPAALRRTYVQQLYQAEQDLRYVQEQAGYIKRRSIAAFVKACRAATGGGANQPEQVACGPTGTGPGQASTCEACGALVATDGGTRIESGQLLCGGCLMYFRGV